MYIYVSVITDYNLLLQCGWVIKCNLIEVKRNSSDLTTNSNLSWVLFPHWNSTFMWSEMLQVYLCAAGVSPCICELRVLCIVLQHHPVFAANAVGVLFFSFFFIMQRWNSSHHCCIDTPVTALGPERRTVSVQPNHPNINRHTPSLPCTTQT